MNRSRRKCGLCLTNYAHPFPGTIAHVAQGNPEKPVFPNQGLSLISTLHLFAQVGVWQAHQFIISLFVVSKGFPLQLSIKDL